MSDYYENFLRSIRDNNILKARELLRFIDVEKNDNECLILAINMGRFLIVDLLLPKIDENNTSLGALMSLKKTDEIKEILSSSENKRVIISIMEWAALGKETEILEMAVLKLEEGGFDVKFSNAMENAVAQGTARMVDLLFDKSKEHHRYIIKRLMPYRNMPIVENLDHFISKVEAEELKREIHGDLENNKYPKKNVRLF